MLHFPVRLACVRHAASVDSEPGSNSRLKPDVCRRVVRQTVAGFQPLAFGLQLNPGKPRATSRQRPLSRSKGGVAYLVRSSGLRPEQFSHDWHVQPSCQRPNRSPPERCASVQPGAHKGVSGCPRNSFKLQVPPSPCQPIVPTGFPPVFHNRGATTEGPNWEPSRSYMRAAEQPSACKPMPSRHEPRRKLVA